MTQSSYYFAQVDERGLCFSVAQLAGVVDSADLIPIDVYDEAFLGRVWDGNEWSDPPAPPSET